MILTIVQKIAANATRLAGEFSESAMLCFFLMTVFSLVSMICIRGVVSGLFEMHRSKSSIKKINKTYSFAQKILLQHAWRDCLHAKRFCRCLIITHHCIFVLLVLELLLALFSNLWPALMPVVAWYTLFFIICISTPVCLLNFLLDRYPFAKWKHEFRFRKYHNTSNHDSLW